MSDSGWYCKNHRVSERKYHSVCSPRNSTLPVLSELSKLNELKTRLSNVLFDSDEFPEDVSKRWMTLGTAYLDDAPRLEEFLSVWDWYIEEIVAE